MKILRPVFAIALLVSITTGCATIFKGTSQVITVTSNVDDASIRLDGLLIGTTPFTSPVKKNRATLIVSKDGYRSATLTMSKSLEPIFWGNIILGGTIGSLTDWATGAAYQYAPATYHVELQSADQSDEDFLWQVAVKKFAMVYIDNISEDLAVGDGGYLAAIITLIQGEHSQGRIGIDDVGRVFSESRGNAVKFGEAVVELIE